MPSHDEVASDFVSIVVADGTRIHTQLLANALTSGKVPALFERQDTKGEGAQTN